MPPLTAAERVTIRSRVSMMLCNLGAFELFFIPGKRRVTARSLSVTRHFKVPEGAILVGTYAWPFPALDVVEDLVAALAHPPAAEPKPIAKAEATTIATPKKIPATSWTWAPVRFTLSPAPRDK